MNDDCRCREDKLPGGRCHYDCRWREMRKGRRRRRRSWTGAKARPGRGGRPNGDEGDDRTGRVCGPCALTRGCTWRAALRRARLVVVGPAREWWGVGVGEAVSGGGKCRLCVWDVMRVCWRAAGDAERGSERSERGGGGESVLESVLTASLGVGVVGYSLRQVDDTPTLHSNTREASHHRAARGAGGGARVEPAGRLLYQCS